MQHALEPIPGRFAFCRLDPHATPPWAYSATGLVSITRTPEALSIIVAEDHVPPEVTAQRGWRALAVAGTLPFTEVGVLAALAGSLAKAGIPLCAVSTYDTDILFIKADQLERGVEALAAVADVSALR